MSLVTDNSVLLAEKLNLYVISKNNLSINSVKVKTEYAVKQFNANRIENFKLHNNTFLIEIDLLEENFPVKSFFQILLNVSSFNSESIKLNFFGEFFLDGKLIADIGNINEAYIPVDSSLIAEIKTYKPLKIVRNALRLESGSSFDFELTKKSVNNLWLDFWVKHYGNRTDILNIFNKITNKTLLRVMVNGFEKLCVLDGNTRLLNDDSTLPFLSGSTWNHIGIELNFTQKKLSFYSNGELSMEYLLNESHILTDLTFSFGSDSTYPFIIEQLRLVRPKNGFKDLTEESKFNTVNTETAEFLTQFNFDSQNELMRHNSVISVKSSRINFVPSDAPIISRSPELNLVFSSSFNQLEWKSSDIRNVSKFIVEKSTAQNSFVQIGEVDASGSISNNFQFIDESNLESEIIYYRIKQIHKDGSSVYSSQVKVGLGDVEQFSLDQNYPNPFNPVTNIVLDLFEDTEIEIIVYNLEGQEIAKLQKGFLPKGIHKFDFDGSGLPSGVYLYKVSSPVSSQTKKMLLTK
jgi:hypothetical protein